MAGKADESFFSPYIDAAKRPCGDDRAPGR
jgi:hypothetical protein